MIEKKGKDNGKLQRSVLFFLKGKPVPLQRGRSFSRRVWDSQKEIKLHDKILLSHQLGNMPKFEDALRLDINFYFTMPKSMSDKKRLQLAGKPHIFKPDIDNCIKYILDIGNRVLYYDDSTICEIFARKLYDDIERTEFIITELR